jgi:hypothetical protein
MDNVTLYKEIYTHELSRKKDLNSAISMEKSDILTTLDRFRKTMHFRLPKTTLS